VIQFIAIAAAVFFSDVKPLDEVVSEEERRHRELLAALRASPW
jgi:hypothetical protein